MKKILVPIDFTPASRNAGEYAAALAQVFGAEIYLLHVSVQPASIIETPLMWVITKSDRQDNGEALMNNEVDFLNDKYGIKVGGNVIVGYKGDTISKIAIDLPADLIVMGMKEGNRSRILGSSPLVTIRKTNIPVLVVPENTLYAAIKHIILAADFTAVTDSSCWNLLYKIAEKFDASLQVVHVQKKGVEMATSELPGKLQLNWVLSKVTYLYDEVEDDDVEHGLLNYIQNHPADLMVMMAHQHTIFERLFGTVHTRSLSFMIKLPLLVLEDKPQDLFG